MKSDFPNREMWVVDLLRQCEWAGRDWLTPCCPVCGFQKEFGHKRGCELKEAIYG